MYRCEKCQGTFAHFETPGQCPRCKVWASVRCGNCGNVDHANKFIENDDSCPKCGALVMIPGETSEAGCLVMLAFFGAAYQISSYFWA